MVLTFSWFVFGQVLVGFVAGFVSGLLVSKILELYKLKKNVLEGWKEWKKKNGQQ